VIVCAAPNPSIDKLFTVERVVPGEIHRPTSFVQVPGGKGLNVARAAQTLGAEVRAVALLGGHHGCWIAEELEGLSIPLTAVWLDAETRSSLSVADSATESLTEFYEDGPAVDEETWSAFAAATADAAAGATWVTVSGSLPPGAPADGYEQLAVGGNVAIDSRRLDAAQPRLVKVNEAEATGLTGQRDAAAAARALWRRAGGEGKAAVVTQGAGGAVLVDAAGQEWRGALDATGAFPVGSGDAFLAGLVVALERGDSYTDALRLALSAGGANAEVPGAGRLDRSRAESLAELALVVPL
jgi:1-phosphofructokinase family hexose kinase